MNLVLHSYWRSSCSWRVRIALAFKKLEYETQTFSLIKRTEELDNELRKKNPLCQVPVLEVNLNNKKNYLFQSLPIIEFLEECYPDTPTLLPKDLILRQKARAIAEIISSSIQPLQNVNVLIDLDKKGVDKAQWAKDVITRGFEALEKLLAETSGLYCVGDEITIADVFLLPQYYNAKRFNVNFDQFKLIENICLRLYKLEAFDKTKPETQIDAKV